MHHLRTILFRKYWISDDTGASYSLAESTLSNGVEQKVLATTIHNLKSRLRELSPAETLSPREVLELIVPFYAYELQAGLNLPKSVPKCREHRTFDLKASEWHYTLQFLDTISLDSRLSWNQGGQLSMAVAVPQAFQNYGTILQISRDYHETILQLQKTSPAQIERFSTRTPAES